MSSCARGLLVMKAGSAQLCMQVLARLNAGRRTDKTDLPRPTGLLPVFWSWAGEQAECELCTTASSSSLRLSSSSRHPHAPCFLALPPAAVWGPRWTSGLQSPPWALPRAPLAARTLPCQAWLSSQLAVSLDSLPGPFLVSFCRLLWPPPCSPPGLGHLYSMTFDPGRRQWGHGTYLSYLPQAGVPTPSRCLAPSQA